MERLQSSILTVQALLPKGGATRYPPEQSGGAAAPVAATMAGPMICKPQLAIVDDLGGLFRVSATLGRPARRKCSDHADNNGSVQTVPPTGGHFEHCKSKGMTFTLSWMRMKVS